MLDKTFTEKEQLRDSFVVAPEVFHDRFLIQTSRNSVLKRERMATMAKTLSKQKLLDITQEAARLNRQLNRQTR